MTTNRFRYPEYLNWNSLIHYLQVGDVLTYKSGKETKHIKIVQIVQGVTDSYPKLVYKLLD